MTSTSNIFRAAHFATRAAVARWGCDYRATFAQALRNAYADAKAPAAVVEPVATRVEPVRAPKWRKLPSGRWGVVVDVRAYTPGRQVQVTNAQGKTSTVELGASAWRNDEVVCCEARTVGEAPRSDRRRPAQRQERRVRFHDNRRGIVWMSEADAELAEDMGAGYCL